MCKFGGPATQAKILLIKRGNFYLVNRHLAMKINVTVSIVDGLDSVLFINLGFPVRPPLLYPDGNILLEALIAWKVKSFSLK